MTKIDKTRTFRLEEDGTATFIAIRKFENGQGRLVTNTIEEPGLTLEDINKILEEEVPKTLKEFHDKKQDNERDIAAAKKEIKDVVNTREYKMYKKNIEQMKQFGTVYKKEKFLESAAKDMAQADEDILDALNWKENNEAMKKALEELKEN